MIWNETQLRAIHSNSKNILVSAAAGSGKTAVLVERIKRLIFEDKVPLSGMLIVTFTNAAAAEMRHKIVNTLTEHLSNHDSSFLREQLADIYKAAICTFHAFALSVVQSYYFKIDLPPGLRTCDDAQKALLRGEAADELFEARFQEDYEAFTLFLKHYSDGRSEEEVKRKMIFDVYDEVRARPDAFQWLKASMERLNGDADDIIAALEPEIKNDISEELFKAEAICIQVYKMLIAGGAEVYADLCKEDALDIRYMREEVKNRDLNGLTKLIDSFTFRPFKVWDKGQRANYALIEGDVTPVREKAKKIVKENIKDRYCRQLITDYVDELMATAGQSAYLYELIMDFHRRFSEKKIDKGLMDFADIEHYALNILNDEEVAAEYRDRFKYIFIDEYQDNNVMQEAIIERIAQGNSVFMVGDVKQSIYKFRLAEPELFMAKYRSFSSHSDFVRAGEDISDDVISDIVPKEGVISAADVSGSVISDVVSKEGVISAADALGDVISDIAPERDAAIEGSAYAREMPSQGERIDLNMNYRCKALVIDGVNNIFRRLMTARRTGIGYDGNAALKKGVVFEDEERWNRPVDFYVVDSKMPEEDTESYHLISEIKNTETEAMIAADIIRKELRDPEGNKRCFFDTKMGLVRELGFRDVVVLMRGAKSQAETYRKILSDEGIPAFVSAGEGYFDTVEIETFMNLLKIIDNRRQDISLLSIMYSPVFAFSTEELMDIRLYRLNCPYYEALFAYADMGLHTDAKSVAAMADASGSEADFGAMSRPKPSNSLSTSDVKTELGTNSSARSTEAMADTPRTETGFGGFDGDKKHELVKKCQNMLARLKEWREAAALMELDEFIWMLLKESNYYSFAGALPGGAQRQANLRALADKALDFQSSHMKGLRSFINYAEHLGREVNVGQVKLIGESEDVVRIMTIHKSKGLEFPVVIVAGLGKRFMTDSGSLVKIHKDFGVALRWSDPALGIHKKTLLQNVIERVKQREELAEEIRILYVAFTRAMDKLILLGSMPGGMDNLGKTDMFVDGKSYLELLMPISSKANINMHSRSRLDLISGFEKECRQTAKLRALLDEFAAEGRRDISNEDTHSTSGYTTYEDKHNTFANLSDEFATDDKRDETSIGLHGDDAWVVTDEFVAGKNNTTDDSRHRKLWNIADEVSARLGFTYPYEKALKLKSKYAAGELRPGFGASAATPVSDQPELTVVLDSSPRTGEPDRRTGGQTGQIDEPDRRTGGQAGQTGEPYRRTGSLPDIPTAKPLYIKQEVSKPKFLSASLTLSPAEKGSILHKIIELLDFAVGRENLNNPEYFTDMLNGLVSRNILTKEEAVAADMGKIKTFLSSDICLRAINSDWMKKEAPFVITKHFQGEEILVQGVIDCFFCEGENLVLLDYKSGNVYRRARETRESAVNRVIERYEPQLLVYREALEKIFELSVKESYLYLLNDGESRRIN